MTLIFPISELEEEKRKRALNLLVLLLPKENQSTLRYLIRFLVKVSQFQEYNKMGLHSIATIIAPSLFPPRYSWILYILPLPLSVTVHYGFLCDEKLLQIHKTVQRRYGIASQIGRNVHPGDGVVTVVWGVALDRAPVPHFSASMSQPEQAR